MIKVENIDVWGFEHAIRGMRNPKNSWDKSDSYDYGDDFDGGYSEYGLGGFSVGTDDLSLMKRLYKAGTEHRKYLRQIFVSMDITTNHTVWAEFDTYKVGVTRNSCSKMHKIHVKEFVPDDFSHEGIDAVGGHTKEVFEKVVEELEWLRTMFNTTHEKKYWRAIIDLLPMGYNLRATVTMNYENVVSIIKQRSEHKMDEWNDFVKILRDLPYIEEIIGGAK